MKINPWKLKKIKSASGKFTSAFLASERNYINPRRAVDRKTSMRQIALNETKTVEEPMQTEEDEISEWTITSTCVHQLHQFLGLSSSPY